MSGSTSLLKRTEERFLDATADTTAVASRRLFMYPKPWVTTFYLGGTDGTFPSHAALKVRVFNEQPMADKYALLDVNQPCVLEAKIHPSNTVSSPQRRKFRAISDMQTLLEILKSGDMTQFGQLVREGDTSSMFPTNLIADICRRSGITQLTPLGASHYLRGHLEVPGQNTRITVDSALSFWGCTTYDNNVYMYKIGDMPENIIEMKKPAGNNSDSVSQIAAHLGDGTYLSMHGFSKFERVKGALNTPQSVQNKGMDMKAEGDWALTEIETKLDLDGDGRAQLALLPNDVQSGIMLGPTSSNTTWQRFITVGENGICIMGREGYSAKQAIKYKTSTQNAARTLTRTERVLPYSQEALVQICKELGIDPQDALQKTSAYFQRQRTQRPVLMSKTGRVFAVTTDHCVSMDGRTPLDQTEIEYRGRIAATPLAENADEIASDIQNISTHLITSHADRGIRTIPSTTTKYQWVSKETEVKHGKGNHAFLFLEAQGETINKRYAPPNLDIPIDELIQLYTKYRAILGNIYRIPELKGISEVDAASFTASEGYIKGRTFAEILKDGDIPTIKDTLVEILTPLGNPDLRIPPFQISTDYYSGVPLNFFVDLKPDNFVVQSSDGALYYIDFFPPRLRDEHSRLSPMSHALDRGKGDKLTYIYGDLAPLLTRFTLTCIRKNPSIAVDIATQIIDIASKFPEKDIVLTSLLQNIRKGSVKKDYKESPQGEATLAKMEEILMNLV